MTNPVVLYNLMIHCIEYNEFEDALYYAEELDKIVGYNYYVDYVESEITKAKTLGRRNR